MLGRILCVAAYIALAPFLGGLLDGIDRKLSARMQGRIGPSVLQPFYDVRKLLNKQTIVVRQSQTFLLLSYCALMIFTGCLFYGGSDLLMCFFVLSTAAVFLYFAAVVSSSPYSSIGASRELIQMMAYEPAVLMTCVGFYLSENSFYVSQIVSTKWSAVTRLPGCFAAFVFILTIKMRKSPFDLSTSHHAHQELVKGLTTEMGAKNLALYTVTEWYENIFLLGVVGLFFINRNPGSIVLAVLAVLAVYFLEILIDNTCARVKYQSMMKAAWLVALLAGGSNLLILMLVK